MQHSANKISRARLIYQDGAAASSDFTLSNSDSFVPGNEVEILAGAAGEEEAIFTGIVVRQRLKVREHTAPQLEIECRHSAVKMTQVKSFAYFLEQTDSDAIESILGNYQLGGEIESTDSENEQLLQYDLTDWDFA